MDTWVDKIQDFVREKKGLAICLAAGLLFALAGLGLLLLVRPSEAGAEAELFQPEAGLVAKTSQENQVSVAESSDKIFVDIKGAVQRPGVYQMAAGSRVTDLIEQAGGFAPEADQKSVNLAQKLRDEEVIYVALQGEEISVVSGSSTSSSTENSANQTGKININTASLAELQTLSGIGQKRAQDIIAYREANGGFKSLDELKNVSGIGAKTLEKLQDEITLD